MPFGAVLRLAPLQVDYSGFSTINTQRFGQKFVGKVANPNDILLWHKAAARRAKRDGEEEGALGAHELTRPEALDQARCVCGGWGGVGGEVVVAGCGGWCEVVAGG